MRYELQGGVFSEYQIYDTKEKKFIFLFEAVNLLNELEGNKEDLEE